MELVDICLFKLEFKTAFMNMPKYLKKKISKIGSNRKPNFTDE